MQKRYKNPYISDKINLTWEKGANYGRKLFDD